MTGSMKPYGIMLVLLSLVGSVSSCRRMELAERSKRSDQTLRKSEELLRGGSPLGAVNRLRMESVNSRKQIIELMAGVYWLSLDDEVMGPIRRKILGILVLPFSPTCVKEARRIVLHSPNAEDVEFLLNGDIFGRTVRDLPYYEALIQKYPDRSVKYERMMGMVLMHPSNIYSGAFNRLEEGDYSNASGWSERYEAFEKALDEVIFMQYGVFSQQEAYGTMTEMYLEEMGMNKSDISPGTYAPDEFDYREAEKLYFILKEKAKGIGVRPLW